MSNKDYVDSVLIKLKRKYYKDEVVAALYKKLSERDIEIGKLKSELQHKQHEIKKLEKQIRQHSDQNELVKKYENDLKRKDKEITNQRIQIERLKSI